MVPRDVREDDFEFEVLNAGRPVLAHFYRRIWREPCHDFAGVLRELARDHHVEFKVVKIDAERDAALVERCGVGAVPALVVMERGRVVSEIAGARALAALKNRLGAYLEGRSPDA